MIELLKDKWQEYTIELILVALGITIPFIIAKIIDNIKNKRLEKTYIELLIQDLTNDLNVLKTNLNNVEADRLKLIELIEEINETNQINKEKLRNSIPIITRYYNFIPLNTTFKDLESTGNIKIIENINKRKPIFEYYRFINLLSRMEKTYQQETEITLKPTILEFFPVRRLSQYDFLYKESYKFKLNIDNFTDNVKFENVLLIKTDLLNNLRIKYEKLINLNNKALDELKK